MMQALLIMSPAPHAEEYILLGWNDLGMHCANKSFATIAILPPFNNVLAQAIRKGSAATLPAVVVDALHISYAIPGNTYSVGKTDFWTYTPALFKPLPDNIGLTGAGLSGVMEAKGDYFIVEGVPITPYTDADLAKEDPYQLALLTLLDAQGKELASTRPVVPVSNEIGCVGPGCHSSEMNILSEHDDESGFDRTKRPILCASCHSSNALGAPGKPELPSLSQAIHGEHKDRASCYSCHPGKVTKCLRDVMFQKGMKCEDCHGDLRRISESIEKGRRPWLDEPSCNATGCHAAQFAVNSGVLYRQSKGHGGLYCSACHGSPHAIVPTVVERDNLQNVTLQGFAGALSTCSVCHGATPAGAGPHGLMATGVADNTGFQPSALAIPRIIPNPFNASTVIEFTLTEPGETSLILYDLSGRRIRTLVSNVISAGVHTARWDGRDDAGRPAASGVYLVRLNSGGGSATSRMALIK